MASSSTMVDAAEGRMLKKPRIKQHKVKAQNETNNKLAKASECRLLFDAIESGEVEICYGDIMDSWFGIRSTHHRYITRIR